MTSSKVKFKRWKTQKRPSLKTSNQKQKAEERRLISLLSIKKGRGLTESPARRKPQSLHQLEQQRGTLQLDQW